MSAQLPRVGLLAITIAITTRLGLAAEVRPNRSSAASQTVLTSFPNPSRPNSPFTLTATVSGSGPVPTGTVTFSSALCPQPCAAPIGPIGSSPLDSQGRGRLDWPGLSTPGSYFFSAAYNGDSNYSPSSGGLTHVVAADAAAPIPMLDTLSLISLAVLLAAGGTLGLRKWNV